MIDPTSDRAGPTIRRGKSEQVVGTPRVFIDAVERRFGAIAWDLAATKENSVCGGCYYGPDQPKEAFRDSLKQDWSHQGTLWINPEFANIDPWAAKCATVRNRSGWTLLLVPDARDSNWYFEHVRGKCVEIPLNGRITFTGSTSGYPKSLALFAYGFGVSGNAEPWRWDESRRWRLAPKKVPDLSAAGGTK